LRTIGVVAELDSANFPTPIAFGVRVLETVCQPLHTPGDLVGQLTSRQELVTNHAFLAAATTLYVDPQSQQPNGGGRISRGTARRLADFCNQIDVTWDLYALEPDELLAKLPKEFQRFQPAV
jgi:hypothetical protein